MINIGMLPCVDCKHYKGVKKPDGAERSEHIKCEIADKGNAANKLDGLHCKGYEKDENRECIR